MARLLGDLWKIPELLVRDLRHCEESRLGPWAERGSNFGFEKRIQKDPIQDQQQSLAYLSARVKALEDKR